MTTLPEVDKLKRWFEENYLDGDKIQGGQMLSSATCFEAITQAVDNERASWLNQKANEHDKRIREDERKRCRKIVVRSLGTRKSGEITRLIDTKDYPPPRYLVKRKLVPVEVFGAEDGYGLMDAVSAWSDCNRAYGKIYRIDDLEDRMGETVEILVDKKDLPFFDKRFESEKPSKSLSKKEQVR